MGIITAPNGTPVALETVTVKNNATGTVHSTSATNAAGRWDADIADETQAYRVEIGGASGGTQRVVQAPTSIELEWLFVRYGAKAHTAAVIDFASAASVTLPTNVTMGGQSLDSRFVNITGDVMSGNLTLTATSAGIELGSSTVVNTPLLDFHSSPNVNDYDSRIIASGGGVGNGLGQLSLYASQVGLNGQLVVQGLASLQGGVGVTGASTLNGPVNVGGGLTVVAGQVLAGWGSMGAPGYAFVGDENTGLFRNNAGVISIINDGVIRFSTTSAGADLVGALNMSGPLNVVAGDANIAGSLGVGGNLTVNSDTALNGLFTTCNSHLVINDHLYVGPILKNATGVSLITKAIEVRNAAGVFVGYIPVYSAGSGIS